MPGNKPTVPGHEVACRIVAVGAEVTRHKIGERVLVQTDYRSLRTATSNAAFGYNFEGGLQEYVLMDERVIIDPQGERFLLPAPEQRSASAIALVEPWACVEDSYVTTERQGPSPRGGFSSSRTPASPWRGSPSWPPPGPGRSPPVRPGPAKALESAGLNPSKVTDLAALADGAFDDIVYFGNQKATIEVLNDKLANPMPS